MLKLIFNFIHKYTLVYSVCYTASQVSLVVNRLPANAVDIREAGSIPGSGRSPWRRAWQPTPVFLRGESHQQRSLASYSPRGHKELDMTEPHGHSLLLSRLRLLHGGTFGHLQLSAFIHSPFSDYWRRLLRT